MEGPDADQSEVMRCARERGVRGVGVWMGGSLCWVGVCGWECVGCLRHREPAFTEPGLLERQVRPGCPRACGPCCGAVAPSVEKSSRRSGRGAPMISPSSSASAVPSKAPTSSSSSSSSRARGDDSSAVDGQSPSGLYSSGESSTPVAPGNASASRLASAPRTSHPDLAPALSRYSLVPVSVRTRDASASCTSNRQLGLLCE